MREDSIPTWVSHAKPSEMTKTQIDAITGATPSNGTYSYIWDGTDNNGNEVANGTYTFHIEGTLYWSSIVHYQGNVDMGASENSLLDVEVVYTEETNQNKNMLSNVTAEYMNRLTALPRRPQPMRMVGRRSPLPNSRSSRMESRFSTE